MTDRQISTRRGRTATASSFRHAGRDALTLRPEQLRAVCDPTTFAFNSTQQLEPVPGVAGQERALNALRFGVGVRRQGFNLYVMGPPGTGKHSAVLHYLTESARQRPTPDDWCYLHNFQLGHRPSALRLPAGKGARLQDGLADLVESLRVGIPSAFRSEEFQVKLREIEERYKADEEKALDTLRSKAGEHSLSIARTAGGYMLAPEHEGQILDDDAFEALPASDRERFEAALEGMQEHLQALVVQIAQWRQQARGETRALERQVTLYAAGNLLNDLRTEFSSFPEVIGFLDRVQEDITANVSEFYVEGEEGEIEEREADHRFFRRYSVNVLEQHQVSDGAPVVYEDHPTCQNLIGRIEHLSEMGALSTDYTLIKAGALHRANGGYLILDIQKLLDQPNAWEALKRALRSARIAMESSDEGRNLVTTVSLQPEPIPLDIKVVLIGERALFYTLAEHDADFMELFKVAVDFEDALPRTLDNEHLFARLIATLVSKQELRPLDASGVARTIEYSSRLADDGGRISLHARMISDLLVEADYWAEQAAQPVIDALAIEAALEAQRERLSRIQESYMEEYLNNVILIDTEGEAVGQVNALTVIDVGQSTFGQPSRITASVRLGDGEVVDIEREVDLGGATHAKGVLILNGFLGARFGHHRPLSLGASLVFEQSYVGVDGDSASLAELCALLSALAEAPIKQGIAVTGSINQLGQIQAIGAVNEKIEGFFNLCDKRGLTGEQGVIIPRHNVRHLMLQRRVVEAVRAGKFTVRAVETVEEAVELMTGLPAGTPTKKGRYPKGSLFGRVQKCLDQFAEIRNPSEMAKR